MSTGRSIWWKRSLLVVASTLSSLLLAEGALRALNLGDPILRDVDQVLGWAPIPGAEGWWTREGRAHVRITEHGFRGVEVPPGPREGVLRVAFVGDSYTEAKQVALEDTFFRRAERQLRGCVDRPVEVLAFGVSGFGTAQERLLIEHRVRRWQPDVVILAVLTGNDVADNHPALRANDAPAPYYALRDGALVLDESFRRSADYRARADGSVRRWVRRHSRLVRLVSGLGRARRARAGRGELGLSDEIYGPPPDATWRDAWARTEALLEAIHRDVESWGARFGVVTLSNAPQVDPDPSVRDRVPAGLGVADLDYPDRRIAAVGARAGFDVLTLVPLLRAHAEAERVHLHGFPNTAMGTGHWNATGHRVAGAHIGEWLCDRFARRNGS
ncbi:MAG TPA: SGNH/GDSL hydrolase family protein [Sandaracinaceae bacterium LLY-WYZ-13_1]|nr:SGNH/GDSL hydrolase family protein [Sandaracinaceae bacterium LLY-WYZ-13_1]